MQPTADFDAARLARSLLRRSRQGALATLMAGSGDPYCSLVNVASHPDGSPILLISRLALHTRNILGDTRVSLMLDERARAIRWRARGSCSRAGRRRRAAMKCDLAPALPQRPSFRGSLCKFKDFSFFRIRPAAAHLVAGFGRIVDLEPEQFLTDISDAASLLEAEQGAIDHMNADHREAMNLYATKLLGAEPADWRCTGCDPDWHRHAGGRRDAAAGFPAADRRSCRIAAGAEAISR